MYHNGGRNFVISTRDENNMVLVVNMTTFYDNDREDKSCILEVGDHDKIKQKLWINYHESEELDITKLLRGDMSGDFRFGKDISDEVLKKN